VAFSLPTGPEWPICALIAGARRVHRAGQLAQARQCLGSPPDLAPVGAPFPGDGAVGDGGHGDAAGGVPDVEVDELVGDQPVAGHVLVVADLMIRFRRVTGPSFAGPSLAGADRSGGTVPRRREPS
jgi:hypothetical protein